jgi:hypothetical protein
MGYLLVTKTDILKKVTGRSGTERSRKTRQAIEDHDRAGGTYYGHVSLRSQPTNARKDDGTVEWTSFYMMVGEGPAVLPRVRLRSSEVRLVVEMTGLGQKTVRIPVHVFAPLDKKAPDGKTSHEAEVTVDLQNPPPAKDPEIIIPVPPGARRPPAGSRGRLKVRTVPEGARVWLYAGYTVDLVDTDPTRPMRFMVQLAGHRTAFVNLRTFRSRRDPGSWSPDPQGPRHVRFHKLIKLERFPKAEPPKTSRRKSRRRRRRRSR